MESKEQQDHRQQRRFRWIMIGGLALGVVAGLLIDDLSSGVFLGLLVGYLAAWRLTGRELPMTMMQYGPGRVQAVVLWFGGYLVALFVGMRILESEPGSPWNWLAAALPLIPEAGLVWSLARAFASLDEFQRRIQSEALAIGFGLAILGITGYGMLQIAGAPPLNWLYAGTVLVFGALVGKLWTQWKYR